jgi:16S rRNA (guanine(527)-N(7))-methyltransferase RsmG
MTPARIAELLKPFLGPAATQDSCHSEPAQSAGEEPAGPPVRHTTGNDHQLTTLDLDHISIYIDILLRWNARMNLTAIRSPEQIVTRHFGESLFAARHLFPERKHAWGAPALPEQFRHAEQESQPSREPTANDAHADHVHGNTAHVDPNAVDPRGRAALQRRVDVRERVGALAPAARANDNRPTGDGPTVADLGSGAGFPGIPLKLWTPHISLALIESNHKKATFLREVTRALTLTDVNIITARAETLPDASYKLVTLRAVERFAAVLPVAARLVSPGGRLALLIGSPQLKEAKSRLPQLTWQEPLSIPTSRDRILAVGSRSEG